MVILLHADSRLIFQYWDLISTSTHGAVSYLLAKCRRPYMVNAKHLLPGCVLSLECLGHCPMIYQNTKVNNNRVHLLAKLAWRETTLCMGRRKRAWTIVQICYQKRLVNCHNTWTATDCFIWLTYKWARHSLCTATTEVTLCWDMQLNLQLLWAWLPFCLISWFTSHRSTRASTIL